MTDWLTNLGIVIACVLILIPVTIAAGISLMVLKSKLRSRAAERRRITLGISGLGLLTTTDERWWSGNQGNLQLCLESQGSRPDAEQVAILFRDLEQLPRWTESAQTYLRERDVWELPEGGAETFEAESLQLYANGDFILGLAHPADSDGIWWVKFTGGVPVDAGRND